MKKYSKILWVLFFWGCASSSMTMRVQRPAEINLKGYEKISVANIVDQWGRVTKSTNDTADKITEVLFNSGRYQVLDRQHLGTLISEHELGISGLIDESTAAQLGQFIGSAVLVFGRIQLDKYDEETSKGDPSTDKEGKSQQNFYRTGTYDFIINIRVVDVQTSKILAVKTLETSHKKTTSAVNKPAPRIDSGGLYAACLNEISSDFLKLVAPYYAEVRVSFQTDGKLPEVNQALAQFKMEEWDKGIEFLKSATHKEGLKPAVRAKAFYNLGLAETYMGNYEQALESLSKALTLHPGSSRYQRAISETRSEKENATRLKEQL